ncbi:MAG TPA: nicotinate (nicotinamide) nucleotide adenylyltransferase [Acidobacteriaceae bacterium]
MRLALFGGTFDPIHRAHLRVAQAAADAFALDRVLFAPTGRQPLKSEAAQASFEDRLAMLSLAIAEYSNEQRTADNEQPDRFAVSALDAPRPSGAPNYTVDLLEDLARTMPHAELFAIAGADSFLTLAQWRAPERVLTLAEWIVVSRPGLDLTPAFLDRPEFAPLALSTEQRARIRLLPGIHEDISATALRERLHDAADNSNEDTALGQWLSPSVAAYIRDHHLYR